MYSKHKTQNLIKKYSKQLLKDLELIDWKCHFYVMSTKDKCIKRSLSRLGFNAMWAIKQFAVTVYYHKKKYANIVIFHDKLDSKKEVVSTIYHELVHIALSPITKRFTNKQIKKHKLDDVEEEIVRVLEKTYLRLLK